MSFDSIGHLDLHKLVALQALLEHRSISGAGRHLGVPQPTLSHLLRQLRETFSDPILVRSGNRMVLTRQGEALQAPLGRAIQSLLELGRTEPFRPAEVRVTFRVACTDFVAGMLFPQVVQRLRRESPGLHLALENWGTRRVDALGDSALDLGIGTKARTSGGIYQCRIVDDEFVCITARANPRALRSISPVQFAMLPHMRLSVKGTGGGVVDRALEQLGLKREIALSIAHFWLAADFLKNTDLVLTAPRQLYEILRRQHPFLTAIRLPLEVPRFQLHLFWHERVHHDPAHTYLRTCILDGAGARDRS